VKQEVKKEMKPGGKKGDKKTTSNADAALKTGSIGGIMAASGGRFGSSLAAATGGVKNLPDKTGGKKGDKKGEKEAKDKSKKKFFTRVKSFLGKKGEGVNAREVYRRQRKRGGSTKNLLTTDRKENYTMTGSRGKGLDVDSDNKSYDSRYKKKKGEGQKAKAMAKRMIELSATKPVYEGPGKAVKNNNKTGPGGNNSASGGNNSASGGNNSVSSGNKSAWNTTKWTDAQLKTRNKRAFNVLKKGR